MVTTSAPTTPVHRIAPADAATTASPTPHPRVLDRLPTISLADLNSAAALQTRVDRKYIVTAKRLDWIIDALADRLAVLEIDGQKDFGYESSYFDTESLGSFWDAARSRPNRVKVRTRSYLDSTTTMLEVKVQDGQGTTTKMRQPHTFEQRRALGTTARAFVDGESGRHGFAAQLVPVLTTIYRRATLVDSLSVARLTIDAGLRCIDWRDRQVDLDARFIVESKSSNGASFIDLWLWRHGVYPEKISKYGTGLAALHPDLQSDKWRRTLDRHFTAPQE